MSKQGNTDEVGGKIIDPPPSGGDRGVPDLMERKRNKVLAVLCGVAAILLVLWINFSQYFVKEVKKESKQELIVPAPAITIPPAKKDPIQIVPAPQQVSVPQVISQQAATPMDPYRYHKSDRSSSLASSRHSGLTNDVGDDGKGDTSNLAMVTRATPLRGTQAKALRDPSMMLTQGTPLGDCYLNQAFNSELPGIVSCTLASDVFSSDGKNNLIKRSSKMVGQFQSAVRTGNRRAFILWTRIETPQGVIAEIDSGATDQLGRAGVEGKLDTRFFERFGPAILFSLLDDVNLSISNRQGGSNSGTSINFGNTTGAAKSTAQETLQQLGNLPPIITMEQGQALSVVVSRDMDFGRVYKVVTHEN